MLRLLASAAIHLLANTVGLILASILLSGFSIDGVSFVVAAILFTLTEVIAGPLITKIAFKNLPALVGGIALVTTFVGLIVTDIFSDGLSITGLSTWILAPLIIWLCALIAGLLLPLVLFKKTLEKVHSSDTQN
jgi:hypothetical protein